MELNMLGHSDVACHLKSIQLITLIEDPSFSRSRAQCSVVAVLLYCQNFCHCVIWHSRQCVSFLQNL